MFGKRWVLEEAAILHWAAVGYSSRGSSDANPTDLSTRSDVSFLFIHY